MDYVIYSFLASNIAVFVLFFIARARLQRHEKALSDLDWDAIATITGDLGTLKRSIQKLNNRLNGMESVRPPADPNGMKELEQLVLQQQQNVMPITTKVGG
jgi:hypothetical protein